MTSRMHKAIATGEVADAMGADPVGYIAYHAEGRVMAFVAKRERRKPLSQALSENEKAELFDTMLAYWASSESAMAATVDCGWVRTARTKAASADTTALASVAIANARKSVSQVG